MNARDELADVIARADSYAANDRGGIHWQNMADKILAAGYRKPRTITTAEELDALPGGSIVLDADPDALLKLASGRWRSLIDPSDTFQGGMLSLPATVLHEPAAAA